VKDEVASVYWSDILKYVKDIFIFTVWSIVWSWNHFWEVNFKH